MVAKRSTGPRELVRLSPLQFSLSVSIVVILLGAAGLAGYFYGLNQAAKTAARIQNTMSGGAGMVSDLKSKPAGTDSAVTFYSELTEPRKNIPAPPPSKPPETTRSPAGSAPASEPVPAPELRTPSPEAKSVMLQVASYKDRKSAQKLLDELASEGYAGTVVQADLGERGLWFRVRVGPYGAGKEADKTLGKLRDERKLKGFVVK